MKSLFIVDIQKRYSSNFDIHYIAKIEQFLKKHAADYDEIVLFIDLGIGFEDGDSVPSSLLPYINKVIFKMYSEDYNNYYVKKEKQEHLYLLNEPSESLFKTPSGTFAVLDRGSKKDIAFVDNHFLEIDYKDKDSAIDIIGGGKSRCVKKTQLILKSLGFNNVMIVSNYCYNIKTHSSIWERLIKKCSVNTSTDIIPWTFLENTNSELQKFFKEH